MIPVRSLASLSRKLTQDGSTEPGPQQPTKAGPCRRILARGSSVWRALHKWARKRHTLLFITTTFQRRLAAQDRIRQPRSPPDHPDHPPVRPPRPIPIITSSQRPSPRDSALAPIDISRGAQIRHIESSFAAGASADGALDQLRHPNKPGVHAVESYELLPDADIWANTYDLFRFSERPGDRPAEADDFRLDCAILRPMESDGEHFLAYYLTRDDEGAMEFKRRRLDGTSGETEVSYDNVVEGCGADARCRRRRSTLCATTSCGR